MSSVPFLAEFPRRRFTVDEVMRMVDDGILQEDEPVELLEGELIVVSPQGPSHAAWLSELGQRLRSAYDGLAHVREEKPLDLSPYSLPEPDLMVVRGRNLDYEARHPRPEDVLLVFEVSVTSQRLDRRKARIYGAAGVPVYWLWDREADRLDVYDQPTAEGYARQRTVGPDDEIELPGLATRWTLASFRP